MVIAISKGISSPISIPTKEQRMVNRGTVCFANPKTRNMHAHKGTGVHQNMISYSLGPIRTEGGSNSVVGDAPKMVSQTLARSAVHLAGAGENKRTTVKRSATIGRHEDFFVSARPHVSELSFTIQRCGIVATGKILMFPQANAPSSQKNKAPNTVPRHRRKQRVPLLRETRTRGRIDESSSPIRGGAYEARSRPA